MKIGDVARHAGVSVETIRYYERLGVIGEADRAASGYRRFDAAAVREVGFVKRAQQLGFALHEIRELLQLRSLPEEPAALVRQRAAEKLTNIEAKIGDLVRMRDALRSLTRSCCGTRPVGECPILEVLDPGAGQGGRDEPAEEDA